MPSSLSRRAFLKRSRCAQPDEIRWNTCGFVLILLCGLLLNSCAGGTSAPSGSSAAPAISVSLSPQAVTVPTNGTTQFVATVANTSSAVRWQVNQTIGGDSSIGTIDSSGMYHAPGNVPASSVAVTAFLQDNTQASASANVTVVAPIAVTPRQTSVIVAQSLQLQAVGPATAAGVNWSSSGGSITANGLFASTTPGSFTIVATSRSDPSATATAVIYVTDLAGVYSWRSDAGLTGQNSKELALSPTSLGTFGKLASCAVDGQVHAQPLYVANVIAGGRVRNLLYVATEHDSVFAFDADSLPCQPVWSRSFIDPASGTTTIPSGDIPGGDISPEVGIASTPVIDRTSGTLYLVARTKEESSIGPVYVQRLHALDIATGSEKLGGPVVISATASGSGDGNNGGGFLIMDPLAQSQRAALTLSGGKLYITFGGHSESTVYHGWMLVYDAGTLAQVAVFNTSPNHVDGGFSETGAGAAADANGYLYATTGNGPFDSTLSAPFRKDFGQTLLKFQPSPNLAIADSFTPAAQSTLTSNLSDFGASGVLVLPDQIGAANPRLALTAGTNGVLYLVNRDSLGGYVSSGADQALKEVNLGRPVYGLPAYWQNTIYVAAAGDSLKAYSLSAGKLADAPGAQSAAIIGTPGAAPVVSSFGGSGGIVWIIDSSGADAGAPAILRAFDATNLARELYNSAAKAQDAAGSAAKYAVPTVANGKVFVGTQSEVSVYGLQP
jgi:hypothetical protein